MCYKLDWADKPTETYKYNDLVDLGIINKICGT